MFEWLKKIDRAILDWLVNWQLKPARAGRHSTPAGMLSTAQTLRQLQRGWGYEPSRYVR